MRCRRESRSALIRGAATRNRARFEQSVPGFHRSRQCGHDWVQKEGMIEQRHRSRFDR